MTLNFYVTLNYTTILWMFWKMCQQENIKIFMSIQCGMSGCNSRVMYYRWDFALNQFSFSTYDTIFGYFFFYVKNMQSCGMFHPFFIFFWSFNEKLTLLYLFLFNFEYKCDNNKNECIVRIFLIYMFLIFIRKLFESNLYFSIFFTSLSFQARCFWWINFLVVNLWRLVLML